MEFLIEELGESILALLAGIGAIRMLVGILQYVSTIA